MPIRHHKSIGIQFQHVSSNGGTIFWSCQKQTIVALSSTETKSIALMHATKKVLWILHFITEVFKPLKFPIKLYPDNQSAITIAYGNQQHSRAKHFNIRLYFIWDIIESKQITVEYMPTDWILADSLTKGLPGPIVKIQVEKLDIY